VWAFHNSRSQAYRNPYGAIRLGGAVHLAIDIWDDPDAKVSCRTWVDGDGETTIDMDARPGEGENGAVRHTCELTPERPEIIWYSFVITRGDGHVEHYGAQRGRTGGEGQPWGDSEPASFQITVYKERQTKPDWYTKGIVYQIFPDRYRRGPGWRELCERSLGQHRNGPDRVLRRDWYETPAYARDEHGRVRAWDFYGGTLLGIAEMLPSLKDMGITALYLNPIFEAASNHRYDTANYLKIDPMLGDEADFSFLCDKAAENGISVILDGVFNHTGCDSIYFNKYGNYDSVGAYQSEDSPYRSWYNIDGDGVTYCSWWGVDDLPDVDEEDPSYRKFIFGKPGGVVEKWLSLGASGWRLDVADELPDDFIAGIKRAVLDTKPDGLLLGEVWEDASNKISYSKLRSYLLGDELDSAMNYPVRDAVVGYVMGAVSAPAAAEKLESLHENYPPDAFAEALNLMGSHDRPRLLTLLGGALAEGGMSEHEREVYRLNDGQRGLAKGRLWLVTLLQMTLPGVPCIYYGDEAGLEGYSDPFNRAGFPWGREDEDCETIYRNCVSLRRSFDFFTGGDFEVISCGEDVFGFYRMGSDGDGAAVLVNRNLSESREVSIEMRGECASELIGGQPLRIENGKVGLTLSNLGSAVVYFHKRTRLAKPLEHGSGILCHITSLPTEGGRPGTMGDSAKRFIDWLAMCEQRYWQVLPINPTDQFGSPYAGISAFAGNTRLIDTGGKDLRELHRGFHADRAFRTWCDENAEWLDPYALFMAIREREGACAWQTWPDEYKDYDPRLARKWEFREGVAFHKWCQYEFARQWDELHDYARSRGVRIIGDMPMYVSVDSSDVWASKDMFRLDDQGYAGRMAGAPPDRFAPDGQLWGNPTYNWDAMRADGYAWWLKRLSRAFTLYDYVRLDHFLGFEHYYSIEQGKLATQGEWLPGPGLDLFKVAKRELGELPIIAEDLGVITPAVRSLVAGVGCPGMDILQFADGDVRDGYQPHPDKISYTGTHDNQTLLGWCEQRFPGQDDIALARDLFAKVMQSSSNVVIFPLQDVIGLDDDARMNMPGTAEHNWAWQARWSQIGDEQAELLRGLTEKSGRV
jgi:4-alpha-glucanotransferase